MRIYFFIFLLFLSFQLMAQMPPAPPSGFCQTKTDYKDGAVCSDEEVVVKNEKGLESYLKNFGLEENKYKNLRIKFSLTGNKNWAIHSPCKIIFSRNQSHSVGNLCLDAKKGVTLSQSVVAMGKKIHILTLDGGTSIAKNAVLKGTELEIFSSRKILLEQGMRLEFSNKARLVSQLGEQMGGFIRLEQKGLIKASQVNLLGFGRIVIVGKLEAKEDLEIESIGSELFHRILFSRGSLKGKNITIKGGNAFIAKKNYVFTAKNKLHIEALGCQLEKGVKTEGRKFSGSCLDADLFNHIPNPIIEASPLKGVVPLTVNFSGQKSTDQDGTIESYVWDFGDGSSDTGSQVSHVYTTQECIMLCWR